jgi:ubiquitin carboxyl-terminal hydrolase 8
MPIDLSKYHEKGYTGIENLGNTCFLNACMQVLNHTYELNDFLDSSKYHSHMKNNIDDTLILTEWNNLRKVMWSGNGTVNPRRFVHNIHNVAEKKNREIFTGFAQNDMPEFLLFIIECIHNSISRKVNMRIHGKKENKMDEIAIECYKMLSETYSKEYSEIMDMFYGIYVSEIVSKDEEQRHVLKPECYFILDLPVLDGNRLATNIYECFDMFSKSEFLEGENAWFNEKTGEKEDVKKRMTFWNFPKILVITLKRFTPDGQYKINSPIEFPIEDLDLSKYVCGYGAKLHKYDLYGVCNHSGGVLGGHYTSFVKNSENKWIHFNDTSIEMIDNTRIMITPLAYCLFYRKKNNFL